MQADGTVVISVIGPTTATVDGRAVALSDSERIVLAALVVDLPAGVDRRSLVGLLWPDGPPRTARQSLHNTVSRLRRKLGVDIRLRAEVYRLSPEVHTDADDLLGHLTGLIRSARPPSMEREWFADLPRTGRVLQAAAHLDALLRQAVERRLQQLEGAGRLAEAISVAQQLRRADPTDESTWVREIGLLLAAGRRLDAATTYREARRELPRISGIAPGRRLQEMEVRIWDSSQSPAIRRPPVLVGRAGQLRRIGRLLRAGRTVLLTGPAWSGKSRLAATVLQDWSIGGMVVDCRRSRRRALASIEDVLGTGQLAHATRGDIPVSPQTVVEMGDRAARVLGDCALLVLDDVDRLPPLSHEILARALRMCDVRVLATSRSTRVAVPGRDDVAVMGLGGLSADQVGVLLGVDGPTACTVHQLTGGSAGLALLLSDAAQRDGVDLGSLDRLTTAEMVPPSIGDALMSRLAGLSPIGLAIVEEVATMPSHRLVSAELDQVEAAAPGLVVVDGHGRLRVCHPLLERVVVDQVPRGLQAEADLMHRLGMSTLHQRSA